MRCVFIYGPAASGKLTVAKALQAITGLRLFHNHLAVDTALSLFEFGTPGFVRLREDIWLSAFREAAAAGQSFIFTCAPEAWVPSDFIDKAVDVIESAGGRVLFVELTCSDEVIQSRIETPSRRNFGKLASVEQYQILRDSGAFAFSALPAPALTLATDILSPEQAAEGIRALIKDDVG